MKLNPLGRTGLFVSELCLGTMTFGGGDQGMWSKIGRLQQEDAERIVGGALDAGVSNWAAWQIVKALGIAEREQLARFQTLQAYYTIAGRDLERELVPMLESEGLGLLVWSPLAGGLLSGKYGPD